ncbi:MAG: class I SAM-dependent methyltransferase [Gemmatimonadota bacterium]
MSTPEYVYRDAQPQCSHEYVTQPVLKMCRQIRAQRVIDVGCGNGVLCGALAQAGMDVVGCDVSPSGLAIARVNFPQVEFVQHSVYDSPGALADRKFDAVIATEVIEHLYEPGALLRFATAVLKPAGHVILSTPYHGYLKNIAIAMLGKWDRHHAPNWDGGHVKFFSKATLDSLLVSHAFKALEWRGVGRGPGFWKSVIVLARKT